MSGVCRVSLSGGGLSWSQAGQKARQSGWPSASVAEDCDENFETNTA